MVQLYLDCDGVLADFDKRAKEIFGMHSQEFEELHGHDKFWDTLYETPNFFTDLDVMPDAYELYNGVLERGFTPHILTGCPRGGWATRQKLIWRDKHFPGVPMITCKSKEKSIYCRPGDIIIDDWPKHVQAWKDLGGHWIMHESAKRSLADLDELLILMEDSAI